MTSIKLDILFLCLVASLCPFPVFAQPVATGASISGDSETVISIRDCDHCPDLVSVPSGSYVRGSKDGRSTEQPVQTVTIRGFLLGRTEVTQGQWKAIMGSTPSSNQQCGDRCPVDSVSWDDAQAYLKKLSELTGKQYRLPTESEWEYAARAGSTSAYWWGDTASHEHANYGNDECCEGFAAGRDQWEKTAPVAQFPPNAFGLYDMLGNVAEWVEDVYHRTYTQAPNDGAAWLTGTAPESVARVVRGGAWLHDPMSIRSSSRAKAIKVEPSDTTGFRVARSL